MNNFKKQFFNAPLNTEGGPLTVAPDADETIERSAYDLANEVVTPASGVGLLQFPYPQEALIGIIYHAYCKTDGGGEVKLVTPAGVDIIGDNLGAEADEVAWFSDGNRYCVIKDVTN